MVTGAVAAASELPPTVTASALPPFDETINGEGTAVELFGIVTLPFVAAPQHWRFRRRSFEAVGVIELLL
jgi:hypothetical protein